MSRFGNKRREIPGVAPDQGHGAPGEFGERRLPDPAVGEWQTDRGVDDFVIDVRLPYINKDSDASG